MTVGVELHAGRILPFDAVAFEQRQEASFDPGEAIAQLADEGGFARRRRFSIPSTTSTANFCTA